MQGGERPYALQFACHLAKHIEAGSALDDGTRASA